MIRRPCFRFRQIKFTYIEREKHEEEEGGAGGGEGSARGGPDGESERVRGGGWK